MLKNKSFLQNLNWVEDISDDSASMIEGGQFTVLLRDDGPVRQQLLTEANVTALQITNGSDLNLFYDLMFDGSKTDISISPGEVQTYFGQDETAIATWDLDLATPGVQPRSADLQPGRRYLFYII